MQTTILCEREWLHILPSLRDKHHLAMHVGNSLIGGAMFFRTGHTEADVFPRFAACFFVVVVRVFFPLLSSIHVLPTHKLQLRKELASGAYRLSAWYTAKTSVVMTQVRDCPRSASTRTLCPC